MTGFFVFLNLVIFILFVVVFVAAIILLIVKVLSNRTWTVVHNGDAIRVENTWTRETLYINETLQDENIGLLASRSNLWGKLPSGEEVKVSIGSTFNIHCNIFVGQRLILKK